MPETKKIRIFLAHANEDKAAVMELYDRLKAKGYQPWLDKKDLIPGQKWREVIPKVIESCDIFVACLSNLSISKRGYVQQEFRLALIECARRPSESIFLIPIRLDDCDIPDLRNAEYGVNLKDYHWLDYFDSDGFERLEQAILYQFGKLGTAPSVAETVPIQEVQTADPVEGAELPRFIEPGRRRRDSYTKQLAQLEEELAGVEDDLATTLSTGDRLKLERKSEQLLDKIEDLETKLRELETEPINSPPVEQNALPIIVKAKDSVLSPAFTEKLPGNIDLEMVYIPGGEFMMGSPETEEGRRDTEGPQHRVQVPPFHMGKYPITQAQWRAIASLNQINRTLEPTPSRFQGGDHPVERVSWHDANEFCKRLSQHTGNFYRLPNETEWEYACRAGTITAYSFGNSITPEQANFSESVGKTTPVGNYPANPYGLHDMHGNVDEWCKDHWHENYEGAPNDGRVWLEGGDSSLKVIRGGSWGVNPLYCRSASRFMSFPDYRDLVIGFRVICSPHMILQ